jgi:tetratricopeptide (TPR) repeat protein
VDNPLVQQIALSTFTPSIMPKEMLKEIFVQREQLLQSIVQDLVASVGGTKQYLMMIGSRGMGKTHFVSLVYHLIKEKAELKDELLIAWLREEEYGINSWLYLIIEILRSLSLEGVATEEQISELASLPIHEAEYEAEQVLRQTIGDKTLLIITENIGEWLYKLGIKEQWKFRSFLQESNCCSILATNPKISADTSKKDKPFFGFFTPIHLPVFTHDDAVAMLTKIADFFGNDSLAKFLATVEGKSRVRALHSLAGGKPRVYALFAQLITVDTLEALLPAVIEILDKLTPFYKSEVDILGQSDDQQKIVMYLSRETRAVAVKEITAQCFISADKTTSNALKKLKDKGYVISTQRGREVFYEISDVLMRLCLEMKNARHGDLEFLVDFLRTWYQPEQLPQYLKERETDDQLEVSQYFQQAPDSNINDSGLDLLGTPENFSSPLQENQNDQNSYENWFDRGVLLFKLQKLEDALNSYNRAIEINQNVPIVWFYRGIALCRLNRPEEAKDSYDQAIALKEDYCEAWNSRGVVLNNLGRYDEAQLSCEQALEINPDYSKAWYNLGDALANQEMYEKAIAKYDRAIAIKKDFHEAWNNRGLAMFCLGRYEEAIDSYDHAIIIKSDYYQALFLRGIAMFWSDRYEETINSYQAALKINREHQESWLNLGITLDVVGKHEKAIESYDKALQLKPDDRTWYHRGLSFALLDKYKEANESYDEAIPLMKSQTYYFWHSKGFALFKLGKTEDAFKAYSKAIEVEPEHYPSWFDQGLIYFQWGDYSNAIKMWEKTFEIIKQLQATDASDLIQAFLYQELLPKFQEPSVQKILPELLFMYATAEILPDLGVALTRNLTAIQSPTISYYTAEQWLKMWQELSQPHPELSLAIKMLESGIQYSIQCKKEQNPKQVFLNLPQEMRPLLREALELE